ncbi:MAG: DUF1540 domain-containing protein [Monoglobales bacterium]
MSNCETCGRDKIDGIYCSVTNCIHHTTDNCCVAEHIKVDNQSATTKTETNCSTFELRD